MQLVRWGEKEGKGGPQFSCLVNKGEYGAI